MELWLYLVYTECLGHENLYYIAEQIIMDAKLVPETSLSSTSGEVLWKKITSSTITALLLVQDK